MKVLSVKRIIYLVGIILSDLFLKAQGLESYELNYLFANKHFGTVWPYYNEELEKDSSNTEMNYKMGVCYLNSRSQKDKAISCFKKVINDKELAKQLNAYKLLAEAYFAVGDYSAARNNYEQYEKLMIANNDYSSCEREEIMLKLQMCNMGDHLKDLTAMNTKKSKNKNETPLYENILPGNNYFDDAALVMDDKAKLKRIDTSSLLKEATVAASADGQIMLLYRNDKGSCNLYTSALIGNNWTIPEKLNKSLNNKGWEPHEFISADGSTLYFSSNRPGGYGGKDIYKCTKLSNGEWSRAQNLGPVINSPYNEEAPFINADGVTLYFSSDKLKAKNGFDIFSSTLNQNGAWSNPTTIGYPLNKGENFETTALRKEKNKKSKNEAPFVNKDDYKVTFLDQERIPLTLIKGKVLNEDGKVPGYTEITVANNETGEILGVYNANIKDGQFIIVLPPGKNNNITYQAPGYLCHSENLDLTKDTSYFKLRNKIELFPIAEGSCEKLNNVFFTDNEAVILPLSYFELNRIYDFLAQNPHINIQFQNAFDKRATVAEMKLQNERMLAVTTYLTDKGIPKSRLSTATYIKKKKRRDKNNDQEIKQGNKPIELKILTLK
jgi:tetratricopeptide (TPR) repeat protein